MGGEVLPVLGFGVAFLIGVGLGQVLKWPLKGFLMGAGFLTLVFVLVSPEGAAELGKGLARLAAGWVLEQMGYPPAWGDKLFTPEWAGVLAKVVGDIVSSLGRLEAHGPSLERLGQALVSRWDLAFGMGVLAGIRV